jgi:hypothetical protein
MDEQNQTPLRLTRRSSSDLIQGSIIALDRLRSIDRRRSIKVARSTSLQGFVIAPLSPVEARAGARAGAGERCGPLCVLFALVVQGSKRTTVDGEKKEKRKQRRVARDAQERRVMAFHPCSLVFCFFFACVSGRHFRGPLSFPQYLRIPMPWGQQDREAMCISEKGGLCSSDSGL